MKALTPLKKYKWKVIGAPALKIVECLTQLASPFIVRYMIDVGIKNNDLGYVLKMGAVLLALSVLAFGVTMIAQYLAARVSADYAYDLRKELYSRFLSLKESDLEKFGKNRAMTIFTSDVNAMQNGVMMFMRLILRPPFLVIGAVVLSFIIAPLGGYIVLGAAVLSSAIIALVIFLSPKRYAAVQSDLDQITDIGSDILTGARPIRAFSTREKEAERFAKVNTSYKKHGIKVSLMNALINPFTYLFINAGIVLIAYFGGLQMNEGTLTSGQLASLISYLTLLLGAIIMFSRMIVSVNKAATSNKRINAFLAIPVSSETIDVPEFQNDADLIRFDDVSFAYSETSAPALKHINFVIPKNATIGIIGGTGSGKSTLLSLIEKTYEVKEGNIFFEGVDYNHVPADYIRSHVSYVSQKPSLFAGTIKSNLLLANKEANDEELIEALKKAQAWEYVSKYKDGLDHEVEEGGRNLSGGQKQRLLLARALLKRADLLLLDDSMSALDYLSEKKVRTAINKLDGVAKVFVSQRVTSMMDADIIYVMDKGEIVDSGKHDELMARCAIYREIYEMQVRQK